MDSILAFLIIKCIEAVLMNIKFEVESLQSVISGSSLFLYFDLVSHN